jgi:large subunit ribosomal protein L30
VIKGLGFTRLNQVIERPDNAAIRGMVAKVPHLVGDSEVRVGGEGSD